MTAARRKMATKLFLLSLVCLAYTNAALVDHIFHMENEVPTGEDSGVHWALVVAGSNGWYNYRHQADACHAYQILHSHGIPDERIVVMMYDDLANSPNNPTPGEVINHPQGEDVYHGVPKDYTGEDVTPQNFLNILKGDKDAMRGIGSGKVIESGPNDRVFVNFADHGAPGLIAFPSDELMASDLMDAIKYMYKNKKYKEMVFYIEACESGSMFEGLLPDNINVFATTAANADESSYACYYDEARDTYLGDVYSVNWMEDSDAENLKTETLQKQFQIVKEETNTSHVMEYGDMTISKEVVATYQGGAEAEPKIYPQVPYDAVPAPDVVTSILERRATMHPEEPYRLDAWMTLDTIRRQREDLDRIIYHILMEVTDYEPQVADKLNELRLPITDRVCYERAVRSFNDRCMRLSEHEYALRLLYRLVNMCTTKVPIEQIEAAMSTVCTAEVQQRVGAYIKY